MGGKIVRTIGIARARFKIGMMNLGYSIRRLAQLKRVAAAPVSANTGGVRWCCAKGPRGRPPASKRFQIHERCNRSLNWQKLPKAGIVRGAPDFEPTVTCSKIKRPPIAGQPFA
jgi:hypothetical protein